MLYKYHSFADSQKQNWVKTIISRGQFWFSEASLVNDPFEFRCTVKLLCDIEELIPSFARVEQFCSPGTSYDAAVRKAREILLTVSRRNLQERQWELSFDLWKHMAKLYSMCCFAGVPNSILMWSHYADRHRGVCIGFEPPEGVKQCLPDHVWCRPAVREPIRTT